MQFTLTWKHLAPVHHSPGRTASVGHGQGLTALTLVGPDQSHRNDRGGVRTTLDGPEPPQVSTQVVQITPADPSHRQKIQADGG